MGHTTRIAAILATSALLAVTFAAPGVAQDDTDSLVADLAEVTASLDEVAAALDAIDTGETRDSATAQDTPRSAGFEALRAELDEELARIHPESQMRADMQNVADFEIDSIDEGLITPINAAQCATELQQTEYTAVGNGEGVHILAMCGPVAQPQEQLEWLGSWPTNPEMTYRTTTAHDERDGAIYTIVVWSH
ncbi:MAG: hypothetical protein Q4G50_05395 [Corynebacterium sp.]|uniref:hypothetical protein n=1 Tax=Corynebacterium sp. TaxID=1720 RepID=UPI0026DF28CD|nr:hypothetical protein [Corynebacterium sp.]MDO5669418.1 hypothetical protein [Corynebacterium sp.]